MTALPLLVALASGSTVQITAQRLVHDDARKLTVAEGDAMMLADNAALNADQITWDESAEAATASGHVALRLTRKALLAIVADVVIIRMSGDDVSEIYVYEGVAMRKKNTNAQALVEAKTPEQARAVGQTTMSMTASHLTKGEGDTWTIDDLEFTPCECDFDKPSWHIATSRTTLDLEHDRASLLFPTFYVWKVPVLWFPWLSLPLSDRQTGLLVPKPNFTALNGFTFEQPIFITLGRSADLTLTPGYFFGNGALAGFGMSGPRLATEFRYTPSATTSGRLGLGFIWDLKLLRLPTNAGVLFTEPNYPYMRYRRRGVRGDGSWQHVQELGAGWHDRVNVSFLSDGFLVRDITPDVLASAAGYLRSTATLFHRGVDHHLGLDVILRQDLSFGDTLFSSRPGAPDPVQRLPGLTLALPSHKLGAGFSFGFRGEVARFSPIVHPNGYDRVDLMPRLDFGTVIADAIAVSAFAAWRQDGWFGENLQELGYRGYPLLGATVQTELAKTYISSVRHTIAPSLEIRAVPVVFGAPLAYFDEVDSAVSEPTVQAVAMLRQRVQLKSVGDIVRIDLGQSFNLWPKLTTGEAFVRGTAGAGWVRGTGTVRFDPLTGKLTRVSALGVIDDGKGWGGQFGYEHLIDVGTDRARQPIDLLIGPRLLSLSAVQSITFGFHWRYGGVGLRYDALFMEAQQLWTSQQTMGVSYGPACECWRIEAFGTWRGTNFPDVGASLTITGFGTLGTNG